VIWVRLIEPYLREVESALERMQGEEGREFVVPEAVRVVLLRKWGQIGELLRAAREGLGEEMKMALGDWV